jgi:hypothetical protein
VHRICIILNVTKKFLHTWDEKAYEPLHVLEIGVIMLGNDTFLHLSQIVVHKVINKFTLCLDFHVQIWTEMPFWKLSYLNITSSRTANKPLHGFEPVKDCRYFAVYVFIHVCIFSICLVDLKISHLKFVCGPCLCSKSWVSHTWSMGHQGVLCSPQPHL